MQEENILDLSILLGKETEHNWEPRDRLLKSLQASPSQIITDPDVLKECFTGILACAQSLRTQLMCTACYLLKYLATTRSLDESLCFLAWNTLYKQLGSTKKIAGQATQEVLQEVTHLMGIERFLQLYKETILGEKNVSLRSRAIQILHEFLDRQGRNVNCEIDEILRKGLSDASPDVRNTAASIFTSLQNKSPEWADAFLSALNASAAKKLFGTKAAPKPTQNIPLPSLPPKYQQTPHEIVNEEAQEQAKREEDEEDNEVILQLHSTPFNVSNVTNESMSIHVNASQKVDVPSIPCSPIKEVLEQKEKVTPLHHKQPLTLLTGKPLTNGDRVGALGLATSTPLRVILAQKQQTQPKQFADSNIYGTPSRQGSIVDALLVKLMSASNENDVTGRIGALNRLLLSSESQRQGLWSPGQLAVLFADLLRWFERHYADCNSSSVHFVK